MADRLVIRGGRVLDPATGRDSAADLLIEDGRILEIREHSEARRAAGADAGAAAEPAGAEVIDATGLWVLPGLIDLHAHLRTPGEERKEDLKSGLGAAAAGGFTAVAAMPNTRPVLDQPLLLEWLGYKAREVGLARLYPIAALTLGQEGKEMAPLGRLAEAGAVAFSDDGRPVTNAGLMREALLYAARFNRPVVAHAEDPNLTARGAMHAGAASIRLGLRGIPGSSEASLIARDLVLADETGGHLHIAHLSTEMGVALVRWAKARGIRVTAEVTPHHLLLTEADVERHPYDPRFKMNPPLRSERDRQALLEGLADGTIDCIATDHAPHHADDKDLPFEEAAFGVVGLETALSLVLTELVGRGTFGLLEVLERLTAAPARIFHLPGGSLAPGGPADFILVDPEARWTVDPEAFVSKGRNTPFAGRELKGRVVATFVAGRPIFSRRGADEPRLASQTA